jgi:hypothetical protein
MYFRLQRLKFIKFCTQKTFNSIYTIEPNLHAFQIAEGHCDQQEIFLSGLLSIPLLFGHQEALLVSPQLCHHSTQQEARSLEKEILENPKQKSASVVDINISVQITDDINKKRVKAQNIS